MWMAGLGFGGAAALSYSLARVLLGWAAVPGGDAVGAVRDAINRRLYGYVAFSGLGGWWA